MSNQHEKNFTEKIRNQNRVISLVGMKGSGKTHAMLSMIRWSMIDKVFDEYHLVLPSYHTEEESAYEFLNGLPNVYIYVRYTPIVSELVEQRAEKLRREGKRVLYALDDSTTRMQSGFHSTPDEQILEYVSQSRHLKVTVIIATHSLSGVLKPSIRSLLDYVFLFKTPNDKLIESFHKEFLGIFKRRWRTFNDFLEEYAERVFSVEHGCFMIDNVSNGSADDVTDWDTKNWILMEFNDRKKLSDAKFKKLLSRQ